MSKYSAYRYRAKRNSLEFTIPQSVFVLLLDQECYYCKTDKAEMGVDRIDNNEGYISGNCISSCWNCNRAKSDMPSTDFIEYLKRFNPNLTIRHNPKVFTWDNGKLEYGTVVFDRDLPSDEVLDLMKHITLMKKSVNV